MKWLSVILLVLVVPGVVAAPSASAASAAIPTGLDHDIRVALKRRAWVAAALPIAVRSYPAACSPIAVIWTDGIGNDHTAVSSIDGCVIALNPWLIPHFIGWQLACATIVHEVGHLSGLGHSTDPLSPMFLRVHPIPQCPRTPPPANPSTD